MYFWTVCIGFEYSNRITIKKTPVMAFFYRVFRIFSSKLLVSYYFFLTEQLV